MTDYDEIERRLRRTLRLTLQSININAANVTVTVRDSWDDALDALLGFVRVRAAYEFDPCDRECEFQPLMLWDCCLRKAELDRLVAAQQEGAQQR